MYGKLENETRTWTYSIITRYDIDGCKCKYFIFDDTLKCTYVSDNCPFLTLREAIIIVYIQYKEFIRVKIQVSRRTHHQLSYICINM